jgi:hypothetical protein
MARKSAAVSSYLGIVVELTVSTSACTRSSRARLLLVVAPRVEEQRLGAAPSHPRLDLAV